jgi:hypothetical protein
MPKMLYPNRLLTSQGRRIDLVDAGLVSISRSMDVVSNCNRVSAYDIEFCSPIAAHY